MHEFLFWAYSFVYILCTESSRDVTSARIVSMSINVGVRAKDTSLQRKTTICNQTSGGLFAFKNKNNTTWQYD